MLLCVKSIKRYDFTLDFILIFFNGYPTGSGFFITFYEDFGGNNVLLCVKGIWGGLRRVFVV